MRLGKVKSTYDWTRYMRTSSVQAWCGDGERLASCSSRRSSCSSLPYLLSLRAGDEAAAAVIARVLAPFGTTTLHCLDVYVCRVGGRGLKAGGGVGGGGCDDPFQVTVPFPVVPDTAGQCLCSACLLASCNTHAQCNSAPIQALTLLYTRMCSWR